MFVKRPPTAAQTEQEDPPLVSVVSGVERLLVPQSRVFPLLFLQIWIYCSSLCFLCVCGASAVPKAPAVAWTGSSVATVLDVP